MGRPPEDDFLHDYIHGRPNLGHPLDIILKFYNSKTKKATQKPFWPHHLQRKSFTFLHVFEFLAIWCFRFAPSKIEDTSKELTFQG